MYNTQPPSLSSVWDLLINYFETFSPSHSPDASVPGWFSPNVAIDIAFTMRRCKDCHYNHTQGKTVYRTVVCITFWSCPGQ